jgi:hypothetical protein
MGEWDFMRGKNGDIITKLRRRKDSSVEEKHKIKFRGNKHQGQRLMWRVSRG